MCPSMSTSSQPVAFLIALFWPVIRALLVDTEANDAIALWELLDELGINLFFLFEFIFNFIASKFVTTIMCIDLMLQFIVSFQTQDGMYTAAHATAEKTYEGGKSIASVWTSSGPSNQVKPHQSSSKA